MLKIYWEGIYIKLTIAQQLKTRYVNSMENKDAVYKQ